MIEPRNHPISVLYVGLEPSTIFPLLASQHINLVAASRISGIEYSAINPFDRILRAFDQGSMRPRWIARCLPRLSFAMSARARRYAKYVSACALSDLTVFDIEKNSEALRTLDFDILLCNVWGQIPLWLIERCKIGAINIHPSLLPQYRGAVPTLCTLANRDKVSAVSYLTIKPGYDTGDIIRQIPFEVTDNDDFESLEGKIEAIVNDSVCGVIIGFFQGKITLIPSLIDQDP